jgi:hypothetical protein
MIDISPDVARISNVFRRLTSDQTGEVEAAMLALARVLKSIDRNIIFEVAERIEKPGLSQDEMQKIFDAGYDKGIRIAEAKFHGDDDFSDTDGKPTPERMVRYCQRRADRLRERECEFIDSVAARVVYKAPTEKQLKWLTSIFLRLGGGRP